METQDQVCDNCGLIHKNGISWHGRCYDCGGELKSIDLSNLKYITVTPGGIELFQEKTLTYPKTMSQDANELEDKVVYQSLPRVPQNRNKRSHADSKDESRPEMESGITRGF